VTQRIDTLADVAQDYDAIVFDQWGVLHNGTAPYSRAIECLTGLANAGLPLAVLSNSGKRAGPNALRIADMGFAPSLFTQIMTSGEALWRDIHAGKLLQRRFFCIERSAGDACAWAEGLPVEFTDLENADAVLLMGLPDKARLADWGTPLAAALDADLPIYCSNPDRQSPRADGLVISPGALAYAYVDMGGHVSFYGKPHPGIFDALASSLGVARILMVGDSLEHDIAGAQSAGWDNVLVQGGLYANDFAQADHDSVLANLVAAKACRPPTYSIEVLA
tara:strand:- start:7414 stop:8247 length:834 start_codon:yes stop_codon:yes gene_type:complete